MKDNVLRNAKLVLLLGVLYPLHLFGKQPVWAQTQGSMSRGVQLFNAYDFGKAERQLKKALRDKLTTKQKAQVWVLLSLSQYNQAKFKESKQSFQKALSFDRNVKIPKGQAPQVETSYEAMRQAWVRQHPQPRSRPLPPQRTKPSRKPTIQRPHLARTQPPKAKKPGLASRGTNKNIKQAQPPARKTGKSVVTSSGNNLVKHKLLPKQPATFWSRYGVSTVLIGVGVLGLGIGSGVAALSADRNQKVEELGTNPLVSGQQAESMYQQAQAAWIGGIVTFAASGVCLLTGASLALANLAHSPTTPPTPSRSSSPQTLLRSQ
ncbi:MAG: hypothetical protein EP343_19665 [Deltaproteobacteria bacterium]|nr:MAG: hypothetical protein EP343_19665 [Deltaproteobacteria bacterium]